MKAKRFHKVFKEGGFMDRNGAMFGHVAGVGTGILDAFSPTDRAPSLGLGGAKGMLSGAAMGSQFGPIGTAIGGGVGLITGLATTANQRRMQRINDARATVEQQQQDRAYGNAVYANDPTLATGNKGASYYAMGGELNGMRAVKAFNGQLRPLSSTATEVVGPSHEQGGVDLPQFGAELEGGETLNGTKVFSEVLGYARRHKPIARAIGKIETKPATIERINALNRLKEQEAALYEEQETLKAQLF